MQLALSNDQELFRQTTARFIETELPVERTRKLQSDPHGYDRAWLGRVAELGWFAMLVPEADGGGSVSGDGLLDAAIVSELLGRYVQPGPFVPMNVVAWTIAARGTDEMRAEVLPSLVAGDAVATWAWADEHGSWDEGAGLRAERGPEGVVLSGTRGTVQDAGSADWLLAPFSLEGRPAQVMVPTNAAGVRVEPLESLDLGRRFADVHFDGVTVSPNSILDAGEHLLEGQLQRALVLNVAETVGAADALFDMTVAYAKDRVAFGRPIGSFQALKHMLADQALALETCKAVAVAAARAVQSGDSAAAEVTSMAAAVIAERSVEIAQQCLQLHGGIGYTWEHDLHLFLRRIQSNAAIFGDVSWHLERVCRWHGLGRAQ